MNDTNEPTENPNSAALDNLVNAVQEFKDIMQEVDDAGLTPFITEANRDTLNQIKAGIFTDEPEPAGDISTVENAARELITGMDEENPQPEITGGTLEHDPADAIVKGFAGILSAAECRQAVSENPQPEITEPDPLKARVIGMLTENTGCDILDSGGAYGRMWQSNRQIPVDMWDKSDACNVDVCGDNEVIVSYEIYHYLTNFLSITEDSERLNQVMRDIVDASDEGSYIPDMETFLELKGIELEGYALHNIINTYGHENILSQILQYAVFEVDGETFILLQVHGGCDARGGYTCPQVFALEEADYFIMASQDISAHCDCSDWSSDDAGCHYYKDGSAPSPDPNWEHNPDENTITCRDCGKPVKFYVTESV